MKVTTDVETLVPQAVQAYKNVLAVQAYEIKQQHKARREWIARPRWWRRRRLTEAEIDAVIVELDKSVWDVAEDPYEKERVVLLRISRTLKLVPLQAPVEITEYEGAMIRFWAVMASKDKRWAKPVFNAVEDFT